MARLRAVPYPALLTALALASTLACKSKTDDAASTGGDTDAKSSAGVEPATDGGAAKSDEDPEPATHEDEPDDPRAAEVAIAKATAAAGIGGKGARSLGFSIEKISHLFALKATPKLPDWGASGEGEAKLTHDDDLDSAWRCDFGQDKPCVIGLALPEPAKVEVLRLYTAAGPRYREYKGHPRVAKVRVHTDAGYVDATLADGANHAYVRFDAPIETRSLAVEVLELHDGKNDAQIHLAELEVYGTDGVPRPPVSLDPAQAWVGWETSAWSGDGQHTIRQLFVYFMRAGAAGEDGPPRRRFARATAVFGQAGDDYALFERLHQTSCDEVDGNYMLFDKRNRMYYALGELGGAGAQVFRHAQGHGFAVGWMNDEGQFTVKGIVEEGGKLVWKRPPKSGTDDGKAVLAKWGFDPDPLPRGVAHGGAVPGCHRAGAGELEPVVSVAKLDADDNLDPAAWMICSVGADTVYASAPCDAPARAYQLDTAGKLVGKHENKKPDARGLRLRRTGDQLYVELSAEQGDTATLILATPGAFTELERNGALFVRPPSSCAPCEDAWQNPEGSFEDGDEFDPSELPEGWDDEDYRDEGDMGEEPEPDTNDARPIPTPQ